MRMPEFRFTMRRLMIAATLACGCSVSTDDKPPSGDLGKLQGAWRAKTGPNGDVTADLEIRGNRAIARLTESGRELTTVPGTIALNERADPKTFDMVRDGEKESGYLAIYQIEEDTFTICTGTPKIGRPTRFQAGENGVPALKVYKRVQAKTEKPGL